MRAVAKVVGLVAVLALVAPASASAICARSTTPPPTPTVTLDAVALTGRPGSLLTSPARMLVLRYRRGSGPRVVRLQTALFDQLSGLALLAGGFTPSAGQAWRLSFRLTGGRHRVRAGQVLILNACRYPPRRLPTPLRRVRGGRVHAGPLVAQAESGPFGLVCAKVNRARACGIGEAFDVLHTFGTAVVAVGPDVLGMRVAGPDGAGAAVVSTNGRVALTSLRGYVSADVLGVTLNSAMTLTRVLPLPDTARAQDPLGAQAWTARAALLPARLPLPHSRLCAGFVQDPPRFGTGTVIEGRTVCSPSRTPKFFFRWVSIPRHSISSTPARKVLIGAGEAISAVDVTLRGATTTLLPAVQHGAFLGVFPASASATQLTIVVRLTDGSAVRFINLTHGSG